MASDPRIFRNDVYESGSKRPRARIVDENGDVLVQANFSGSVQINVYDLSSATPSTALLSTTRTIANTVHNSLQTWSLDPDGYNFSDTITSNEVAWEGGHTFRISYLLTHTTTGFFPVIFEVRCLPLLSA